LWDELAREHAEARTRFVEEPAFTWVVGDEGTGRRATLLTSAVSVSLAVDGAGLGAMLCGGTMAAGNLL
jgi:hypothetical protein